MTSPASETHVWGSILDEIDLANDKKLDRSEMASHFHFGSMPLDVWRLIFHYITNLKHVLMYGQVDRMPKIH